MQLSFRGGLLAAGALLLTATGALANPTLLRDINTTLVRHAPGLQATPALTALDFGIARVNGIAYFNGTDASRGSELWRSDGTAAGTWMVKDINPSGSSFPGSFTEFQGQLFFAADNGSDGQQIWKTDGTAAGTGVVSAFGGITGTGSLTISQLRKAGGYLFFAGGERVGGGGRTHLYRTDGTAAGTIRLTPATMINANILIRSGSKVFFTGQTLAEGHELWVSDGTVAGTMLVKDIAPGSGVGLVGNLMDVGGILYFSASEFSITGTELWRSDGTAAGTFVVKDIAPGFASSQPAMLTRVGATLYFAASDGINGRELWKSDGTAAGTVMVKDITPGAGSSGFGNRGWEIGNILYFTLTDSTAGNELWRSDGTAAGTFRVADINPGTGTSAVSEVVESGGATIFFRANDGTLGVELWRTNGSSATLVRDIFPGVGSSNPTNVLDMGGFVLFSAEDAAGNRELWRSDGTASGTTLVVDINPGSTSSASNLLGILGNEAVFAADDGVSGQELWKTDGTPAGTVQVRDINPGASGSAISTGFPTAARLGGVLLFAANDGVNGTELWRTDGTAAGTFLVKDINLGAASSSPTRFTEMNGVVYFVATQPATGAELWRTDGTTAGTSIVSDIVPGPVGSNPFSTIGAFTQVNGKLLLMVSGASGVAIWVSDGTAAGTAILVPPLTTQGITVLAAVGSTAYFLKGVGPPAIGALSNNELWRTDGTPAGTAHVQTFVNDFPQLIWTEHNGVLYLAASNGVHGQELWRTDGTTSGTFMVKDILPGINGSFINQLRSAGGFLWINAIDGTHGRELWRSDGTTAGTVMLADLYPGPAGANPGVIAEADGVVYLSAFDPVNGRQLWKTDGTAAGTSRISSISGALTIAGLAVLPTGLVLNIDDGSRGFEPWFFSTASDTTPDAFAFATATNVAPGFAVTSNVVTPTGYTAAASATVSGGEYSAGCTVTFTSAPGNLAPGQSICVRHVASTNLSSGVTTTLTIGGVSGTFTSMTMAPNPAGAAANDVNGDGRADLVWVDGAGNVQVSFMNGGAIGYSATFALPAGSSIVDVGDFNGDGRADLLLVNAGTGAVAVALFNGSGFSAPSAVGTVPGDYAFFGAVRVNGSVSADIVWRSRQGGRFFVWTMNGATITAVSTPAAIGNGWEDLGTGDAIGVGDANGDGSAEVFVANGGGEIRMLELSGPAAGTESRLTPRVPSGAALVGLADIDGDGKADLMWKLPDGTLRAWLMNGASVLAEGSVGVLPAGAAAVRLADLSGDGRADIVVRLANGSWQLWTLSGPVVTSVQTLQSPGGGWSLAGR